VPPEILPPVGVMSVTVILGITTKGTLLFVDLDIATVEICKEAVEKGMFVGVEQVAKEGERIVASD